MTSTATVCIKEINKDLKDIPDNDLLDPLWAATELALEDVRANRVVDGDEVLSWIESWGTQNELPKPCVK